MLVEPLELEVLATVDPVRDVCVIADLLMERHGFRHFLRREQPDVVCITGYITNVPAMLDYCRQTKRFDERIRRSKSIASSAGSISISRVCSSRRWIRLCTFIDDSNATRRGEGRSPSTSRMTLE